MRQTTVYLYILFLSAVQFEIAPKPSSPPKTKKGARKLIQSDDDETEWNENQLQESGDDDGSAYEVGSNFCVGSTVDRT